jgi:mRNA-degrading endonuclease RelE of RelBE toxin-antitoxin system
MFALLTVKLPCRFCIAWIASLPRAPENVKKLKPPLSGFRLRCGDYRIFFDLTGENSIGIAAVLHRREAYR